MAKFNIKPLKKSRAVRCLQNNHNSLCCLFFHKHLLRRPRVEPEIRKNTCQLEITFGVFYMGRNNRRLVVFPGEAGLILLLFLWVFNENICGKMIGYSLVGKLKRTLRSYGLTFALLILKYQFSKQFSHTFLTIQVQRIRGLIVTTHLVENILFGRKAFLVT